MRRNSSFGSSRLCLVSDQLPSEGRGYRLTPARLTDNQRLVFSSIGGGGDEKTSPSIIHYVSQMGKGHLCLLSRGETSRSLSRVLRRGTLVLGLGCSGSEGLPPLSPSLLGPPLYTAMNHSGALLTHTFGCLWWEIRQIWS